MLTLLIFIASFTKIFLALWTLDSLHLSQASYIIIYLALGTSTTAILIRLVFFIVECGIKSGAIMHDSAMQGLLNAPIYFFDEQPVGRILNRMTLDVREVDGNLPLNIFLTGREFAFFMTAVVVVSYSSVYVLGVFGILVVAAIVFVFPLFRASYRELRRLSSIMISPLLTHVSETLNGVPSIRAYQAEPHFQNLQRHKLDRSQAASLYLQSARSWLGLRLDLLTSVIVLCLILLGAQGVLDPVNLALGLSGSINLGTWFNNWLMAFSSTEAMFNCVERLNYYSEELPREEDDNHNSFVVEDPVGGLEWPVKGAVNVKDLELRYQARPERPVIKDLTFSMKPGEKVGVVGRTGSGKSSLASAFFRMINITGGNIIIDGHGK
jgi:ABC-type multidrug transport system fused ATPase/permease subunit